ncbi:MAG: HipA N-terminal domain-containing protein [Deltaproteobacteria bacterium]|nr:HipA N-terminal domain-containing protein [Deltaproteobacteria bacterium]MBN2673621.1 HipA N-terminal domain-containing protein [Deltaproteobacteria bacterium]
MTGRLQVQFESHCVGILSEEQHGEMVFQYDDAWLAWSQAFPVSLRLPLEPAEFGSAQSKAFFFNLLPEGIVRQLLCRRLGISEDNDFALLEAIGGECAGALRLVSDFILNERTAEFNGR